MPPRPVTAHNRKRYTSPDTPSFGWHVGQRGHEFSLQSNTFIAGFVAAPADFRGRQLHITQCAHLRTDRTHQNTKAQQAHMWRTFILRVDLCPLLD